VNADLPHGAGDPAQRERRAACRRQRDGRQDGLGHDGGRCSAGWPAAARRSWYSPASSVAAVASRPSGPAGTARRSSSASGVDDVQDRQLGVGRELLVPGVRGVARDRDAARPCPLQTPDARAHRGERRRAAALEDRRDPVRHPGVRDHDHRQVILLAPGRAEADQLRHEVDGRRRPHAAQHPEHGRPRPRYLRRASMRRTSSPRIRR
jgi:hypothetical protein